MLALLHETLQIEANGGMLRADGSRRTVGGVFFYLVKQRLFQAGEKQLVAKLFWKWQAGVHQRPGEVDSSEPPTRPNHKGGRPRKSA